MKITNIKIENFRTYDNLVIKIDDKLTSFIGKNDIGKSTIFDALDIFFGNKKIDVKDLCVDSPEDSVEITCTFSNLPEDIEIDSSAKTKLSEEFLLNEKSELEIKKVYKCNRKTVSAPVIFIIAEHPNLSTIPLLHNLNQKELSALGKERGLSVEDDRVNNLWRKAIWNSEPELNLVRTELKIDNFDKKAKQIYSKIEDYLPLFFVFRSDREMVDSDDEVKSPMQIAVAKAQEIYEDEIRKMQEKIQREVESVTILALEKLREIDPSLADELNPVLRSKPTWKFDYSIEDERGIALNKRGSGTRRLVLMNFFRAQAERKSTESKKGIIYAIEEPETSQHPDNQKMIIEALCGLANDSNRQVLITTHSSELLREIENSYGSGIRFIQSDSSGFREVEEGKRGLLLSASALGILGKQMFGSSEKIILVEGAPDCLFLEHVAKESFHKEFKDLKIQALPVGGCRGVMDWVLKNRHKDLGIETFVFLDSDRKTSKEEKTENEKFIESLSGDNYIKGAFCTKKREIENYLTKDVCGVDFGDFDKAKHIISTENNIGKSKIIETYWVKMRNDQIDEEIKKVIKNIIS